MLSSLGSQILLIELNLYAIIAHPGAKMKKKETKKLNLNKEKISSLNHGDLKEARGASLPYPSACFCEKTICCTVTYPCSQVTNENVAPEDGDIG